MNIELKEITIRELVKGYYRNEDDGVVGYGGKLDIRPPYQRNFVYKDKQRDAVIETVKKDFPLNVLYWAVREDGKFEVIDGQQRIISICEYVTNNFSFNGLSFDNLQNDQREQILDYKLMVYFCSGTDSEKLKWFETINIAGEELTNQELRNAVYHGSWVTDAKRYFSRNGCAASQIGSDYLNGSAIRQDYFEIAIKWISKENIEDYMSKHQHDQNASALWRYFQDVISWVEATFIKKRKKFMKGVDWGTLYNEFKDEMYNTEELENKIAGLMADDDVVNKKGIYPYILTGKQKYLSIRTFSDSMKQKMFEKQKGKCPICGKHFELEEMEADHIMPWHKGGQTTLKNCQMLCMNCNRTKSGK